MAAVIFVHFVKATAESTHLGFEEDTPVPIRHAIWQVGVPPQRLIETTLQSEQNLEEMIIADPHILSEEWMLIGRQRFTPSGPFDLLAVAPDGTLILIELKRARTPREVVAQALDYASWVANLTYDEIVNLYRDFSGGKILKVEFKERFGHDMDEDSLNESHQIVIVASELDPSTERIVQYLSDRDIPINVLFFQVFTLGDQQLLSRAWLIDPGETQINAAARPLGAANLWNGEYYVSFDGDGPSRSWDEARQYGFVSAGGGTWYSDTLKQLNLGDRIWVNVPGKGYVGVAIVKGRRVNAKEFELSVDGQLQPALEILTKGEYERRVDDPEKMEYFVPVEWLDTVPLSQAYRETGFFGNQNSVCKPQAPKWRFTVDQLKQRFVNWNNETVVSNS